MYHICCNDSTVTKEVYVDIYDNLSKYHYVSTLNFKKLKDLLFLRGYKLPNGVVKLKNKEQLIDVIEIISLACKDKNPVYKLIGKEHLIFQTSKEVLKYFQDK